MKTKTIEQFNNDLQDHLETVNAGEPFHLTHAHTVNDRVWQGDLGVTVKDKVPEDYNVQLKTSQLVHGQTQGARHCIRDMNTCEVLHHPSWDAESLDGPYIIAKEDTVIDHPTHGAIHIQKGMCVEITYQRNLDVEQRKERRAQD